MTQTRQQMFDAALNGIRKQGGPAINGVTCAYRTSSGLKCAAGHLIPDSAIHLIARQDDLINENKMAPVREAAGIADMDINFVREMQTAHDASAFHNGPTRGAQFFAVFEPEMALIAARHRLNYTEPTA